MTRVRLLSINCRRSTYLPDLAYPTRRWANRQKYMIKFLREVGPSVICAQECTGRQVVDITNGLGANWTFWGEPSNRQVLWDTAKWEAVDTRLFKFKSKTTQEATFVRLKRRQTGDLIWFVSVHLTHGSTNGAYRNAEMIKILGFLQTLPGYQVSVIAGDLNSSAENSEVRKLAGDAGWRSLRKKLDDDQLSGEHYSTFNGWKRTPTTGRWIDDVLTPFAVKPYAGSVELACLRVYPVCASDHNGVRASIEFGS